jgi:hypothetical protein
MKKIKLFYTLTLLTVIFFSCSESEDPASLVGKWEAIIFREYENDKLVYTFNDVEGYFLIFKEDGTFTWEIEGDIECKGSYGSKKMDSKSQKIDWYRPAFLGQSYCPTSRCRMAYLDRVRLRDAMH